MLLTILFIYPYYFMPIFSGDQLSEYHRLKQKVAERTSHLSAVLDNLNREYNEQKDLYDALYRRKNEIESSLKRKETELNENKKRLQKLLEYIE